MKGREKVGHTQGMEALGKGRKKKRRKGTDEQRYALRVGTIRDADRELLQVHRQLEVIYSEIDIQFLKSLESQHGSININEGRIEVFVGSGREESRAVKAFDVGKERA